MLQCYSPQSVNSRQANGQWPLFAKLDVRVTAFTCGDFFKKNWPGNFYEFCMRSPESRLKLLDQK